MQSSSEQLRARRRRSRRSVRRRGENGALRGRVGWWTRTSAVVSDWFYQPHDYDWIISHYSTRGLAELTRVLFAAGTVLFAVCSFLTVFSSHGPTGTAAIVWVFIMLGVQLCVAVRWCVGPMPGKRGYIAFAIFGDVGLTSVLVLYDSTAALTGSVLFAVTGAFCTYFLSPRWLVAHLAWSGTVIILFAVSGYRDDIEDSATVTAGMLAVLAAVTGVPLFAHVAWTAISRDAQRSTLDALTGLYNRRGMDHALDDLWEHAHHRCLDIIAVVVDIDKFKQVNDDHGHATGDEVIASVARSLEYFLASTGGGEQVNRRRADIHHSGVLARTGGEEFLLVLTAPPGGAEERISTLRPALDTGRSPIPVTVSIGAAVLTEQSSLRQLGQVALKHLADTADTMMYRAKEAGGDQALHITL